jgi:hypothetical protein
VIDDVERRGLESPLYLPEFADVAADVPGFVVMAGVGDPHRLPTVAQYGDQGTPHGTETAGDQDVHR